MQVDSAQVQTQSIEQLANLLLAQAQAAHQRRVLLFAGERDWALEQAQHALAATGLLANAGWLGDLAPAAVSPVLPSRVSRLLGQELHALVVDAYAGFDPDAVGAALGALRGGGLLLLLTPPLAEWSAFADPQHARITVAPYEATDVSGRFLQRLARLLAASEDVLRIEQGQPLPDLPAKMVAAPAVAASRPPYATPDQQQAVQAVQRVAAGRARRPLLLIADRGRGKSAAFGIAAAELLLVEPKRILVTGPRLEAVRSVFRHAAELLPEAQRQQDALLLEQGWLRFVAPDALVLEQPAADLLLVDEAAALPVPLLVRLLRHYPRIAFATTVHGYEGTGRGFLLRFTQTLNEETPDWRQQRLTTPVRWTVDDPLERLSFRLLLLDAEAASAERPAQPAAEHRIERLDRDALVADETLLAELFGLLLQAHYRTRPFDLRQLLDGPNIEIHALFHQEHVIGAALVAIEGGLDAEITAAIAKGARRLRGHLLPQSLAFHSGLADSAALRYARIMRLAIHPAWQRQGLGRQLLRTLLDDMSARGLDLAGSSFGGDAALLRFWQRCGFWPVRVGMTRGSASGEHSLLVLQSLNAAGQVLQDIAQQRFLRDLPDQLGQPLQGLEPLLAARLLEGEGAGREQLDAFDQQQLAGFAYGRRSYGDSLGALRRFLLQVCARQGALEQLSPMQLELLIGSVLQGRSWSELSALGNLAGRDATVQAVRDALARLLEIYA